MKEVLARARAYWLKHAAKALVFPAGLLVQYAGDRYGVDSQAYRDVVWALTAVGIWAVPNR